MNGISLIETNQTECSKQDIIITVLSYIGWPVLNNNETEVG